MLAESIFRWFCGGLCVTLFAMLGSIVKPTSFAGIFSAAPSTALATLALTIATQGPSYASTECRSMMAGAVAMWVYSLAASRLLLLFRLSALVSTSIALAAWIATAFILWFVFLRIDTA
jgi:hypothetical protein